MLRDWVGNSGITLADEIRRNHGYNDLMYSYDIGAAFVFSEEDTENEALKNENERMVVEKKLVQEVKP